MDKKNHKTPSKTPRETFSLDAESLEIIKTEQAASEYAPSKSAVVRMALKALKEKRDAVKKSGQADLEKAARLKKRAQDQ